MTHAHAPPASPDADVAHGKRLENIGWGLFLVLTGVIWLYPEPQLPRGTWLMATGILLLGLNAVRAITKVPVSSLTTVLGALALAAGLSALWGVQLPLAAICVIVLGVGILARQLVGRASA
jgi:hypothetical protein